MHPRNIYKDGHPDFQALSLRYPALATYVIQDAKGKARIDFRNKAALRALTRALLLDDFNLNVVFPEDCLVPTIPLRLNYVLWIEDLLKLMYSAETPDSPKEIHGIDIGTGASTVYALLCARKYKWKMTGTDSNPESIRFALKNVERNILGDLIRVKHVEDGSILRGVLQHEDTIFDFTMCNPPFFSSIEETNSSAKSKNKNRPQPSGAKTGLETELVVAGGEIKFIQEMIKESISFHSKVRIFTTMIGVKTHLSQSVQELKSVGVKNYTTTEFSQGKTTRWGLAWTFEEHMQLVKPPNKTKPRNYEPLTMKFHTNLKLLDIHTRVREILLDLKMTVLKEENMTLTILAQRNTWSHQRRKRREQNRINSPDISPQKTPRLNLNGSHSEVQELLPLVQHSCAKSPHLANGESPATKSVNPEQDLQCGLQFNIKILREGSEGSIILDYLDGSFGREGLNQVLQYFKNRTSTLT